MSRYILTRTAQEDLIAIRNYYVDEAGVRVARQMLVEFVEAFRFLGRTPGPTTSAKTSSRTGQSSFGQWAAF